jgi:hypothetical protein
MKFQLHTDNMTNQLGKLSPRTARGGALVLFFFIVALHLGARAVYARAVNIYSGSNIPAMVSNNPAGTTFVVYPGLYRLRTPITAKNGDTFTGLGGAVLSGARLLTSVQHTSFYYYVTGQTQTGPGRSLEAERDPHPPETQKYVTISIVILGYGAQ